MFNLTKERAIKFLKEEGVDTKKIEGFKDSDVFTINKDLDTYSKTFGRYIVFVYSKKYNIINEVLGIPQKGEYKIKVII